MHVINSAGNHSPAHLDIRDLRLVAAIAETGSVTNAARVLHLTQSTLSHHLAQLEHRINRRLFYRSGRRMVLTPLGTSFRIAAGPILEQLDSMQRNLATGDATNAELRFATECYTTYPWFGRIAREFTVKYPCVAFKLVTEATAQPLLELERGTIDVAITSRRIHDRRKLHVHELFSDELVAIVAKDHEWAAKKRIALEDFRNVHLLAYSGNPKDSDFVREILLPAGIVPQKTSGIQLTEGMLEFARARVGVAVVAKWAVRAVLKSGDLIAVRIGQTGIQRRWKATWLRNHPEAAMLVFFAKLLCSGRGSPVAGKR